MYKIKLSRLMAKQVKNVDIEFTTSHKAYIYGIEKYGSGGYNDPIHGWSVE